MSAETRDELRGPPTAVACSSIDSHLVFMGAEMRRANLEAGGFTQRFLVQLLPAATFVLEWKFCTHRLATNRQWWTS